MGIKKIIESLAFWIYRELFNGKSGYFLSRALLVFLKKTSHIDYISKMYKRFYNIFFDYPKVIMIHPGKTCNLNCLYCYEMNQKTGTPLSKKRWMEIISEARRLGVMNLQILGGEPLVNPDIFDYLDEGVKNGMFLMIYTNGTLLSKDMVERLKVYSRLLMIVSYDSAECFDSQSGGARIELVEKGIKRLIDADIPVRTFITVTKKNVDSLEKIAKRSIMLGAFPVFEKYLPVHDNTINDGLELSADEWNRAILLSHRLEKRFSKAPMGEILSYFRGTGCSNFYEALHVFNDGKVLPCEFLSIDNSIFNVRENSIEECWKVYSDLRKKWNTLPDECSACTYRNSCHGGCKCMTILKKHSYSEKDPYCQGRPPFCY